MRIQIDNNVSLEVPTSLERDVRSLVMRMVFPSGKVPRGPQVQAAFKSWSREENERLLSEFKESGFKKALPFCKLHFARYNRTEHAVRNRLSKLLRGSNV